MSTLYVGKAADLWNMAVFLRLGTKYCPGAIKRVISTTQILPKRHVVERTCRQDIRKFNQLESLLSAFSQHTSSNHSRRLSSQSTNLLPIDFGDARKEFDKRWLRENCRCPECFDPVSGRRTVELKDFDSISDKIDAKEARCDEQSGSLHVKWADGHKSSYDLSWLTEHMYPGGKGTVEKTLWDREKIEALKIDYIPYKQFMEDIDSVKRLVRSVLEKGMCVVTEVPPTVEATGEVGERVAIIQRNMYGTVGPLYNRSFSSNLVHYTPAPLEVHTDFTYACLPPSVVILHCTHHEGEGGENTFVDGFHAAEQLRNDDPKAFELLCKYSVEHAVWDRDVNHLRSLGKILELHPTKQTLERIRYSSCLRLPISTIPQESVSAYCDASDAFDRSVADPQNQLCVKLNPGMVMFADNWRVLHGRLAYTGSRELVLAWLAIDDWMSRARTLGIVV